MVLLTAVLSLDRGSRRGVRLRAETVPPATSERVPELVVARDASGRRQLLPFGGLAQQALILRMPSGTEGRRATVRLYRRRGATRDAEPWIEAHPQVRADGTIPMAGVVAGDYDVEVELDDGPRFVAESVTSPGDVPFVHAAPPR